MQSVQFRQSLQFLQFVLFWFSVRIFSDVDAASEDCMQPIVI